MNAPMPSGTPQPGLDSPRRKNAKQLREERSNLLARYDSGAMPPYIYSQLRRIESDIAWAEQSRRVEA